MSDARIYQHSPRVQACAGNGLIGARLTTTQRDDIPAADLVGGLWIFNVTTGKTQFYDGTSWVDVGGGGGGATTLLSWQGAVSIDGTVLNAYPAIPLSPYIPGYDAGVKSAIVAAFAAGKAVRTNINFGNNFTVTAAGTPNFELDFYPDDGQENFGFYAQVATTLTGAGSLTTESFLDYTTTPTYQSDGQMAARMFSLAAATVFDATANARPVGSYTNGGPFVSSGELFGRFFGPTLDNANTRLNLRSLLIEVLP